MGMCSSLHEDFINVKSHMGLDQTSEFFSTNFTKLDLALNGVIENLSELVQRVFTVFEMFLRFRKSNWNTTRLKIY